MNKIKKMREKRGLTQKELAELIKKKQQHISRWETGLHKPTIEVLKELADILNCQIDDLI